MTLLSIRYERHAQRRDTEANWAAGNPVLADGEHGVVTDSGHPRPFKIGDGSTAWLSLPYETPFFAAASGTDTITATFDPTPVLFDGMEVKVRAAAANTGAATFNPNSLGALALTKLGGTALGAGDINGAGHELILRYRASVPRWELINPATAAVDIAAYIHAATGKTTPVDADEFALVDSAASNVLKKLTWANLKATMWAAWGALIAAGTAKTTPVDGDTFALSDSAASNATKKLSWADIKTTLKSALGLASGSTSTGYVAYNGTTQAAGKFDGGTTAPAHTDRLNYDGNLYANKFFGDGSSLTGIAAAALPVGCQVNYARAQTATPVSTSDTSIPRDDTKPQNTEGVAWSALDVTITPVSGSNLLRVTLSIPLISTSVSAAVPIAIFRDSGADAIWATLVTEPTAGQSFPHTFVFTVSASSTSATTFKVRWCTSAGTAYMLQGNAAAQFFDDLPVAILEVAEIKQ